MAKPSSISAQHRSPPHLDRPASAGSISRYHGYPLRRQVCGRVVAVVAVGNGTRSASTVILPAGGGPGSPLVVKPPAHTQCWPPALARAGPPYQRRASPIPKQLRNGTRLPLSGPRGAVCGHDDTGGQHAGMRISLTGPSRRVRPVALDLAEGAGFARWPPPIKPNSGCARRLGTRCGSDNTLLRGVDFGDDASASGCRAGLGRAAGARGICISPRPSRVGT